MPSFNRVNYSVRPNKNVERKLFAESLSEVSLAFNFSNYRYIGLGSIWFTDFNLFHRTLRIEDMVSMEKDKEGFVRAQFNIPFSCVSVLKGKSTTQLPNLLKDKKRSIIWLDYDRGWDSSVIEDMKIICQLLPSGSVIIVTINADPDRLQNQKDAQNNELETPRDALEYYLKKFFPEPFAEEKLEPRHYSEFVSTILFDIIRHFIKKNQDVKFSPLYNFSYDDGTPMVSVGGMVVNDDDLKSLEELSLGDKFDYLSLDYSQKRIQVPVLTLREKTLLDSILPKEKNITASELKRAHSIALSKREIESYAKYYRYYPTFAEFLP